MTMIYQQFQAHYIPNINKNTPTYLQNCQGSTLPQSINTSYFPNPKVLFLPTCKY